MKLQSSYFVAPAILAISVVVGCGSDNTTGPSNNGGAAGKAGASGSAAGTSSSSGGASSGDPGFALFKTVLMSTCFGNGCHSQEGNPLQMKIDDKLYATLMSHQTATCGKLINTASPADSALIKIMKADCNGTPRMPWDKCFDGDVNSDFCVAPDKVDAIQAWIARGAPM